MPPKPPDRDAGASLGWLLLVYQIPPKAGYARVKVWRQLKAMGAVIVRNSAYVMPRTDHATAHLRRLVKQIEREGGEAALCETRFIEGISDRALEGEFNAALEVEYAALESELRKIAASKKGMTAGRGDARVKLEKIGQKLSGLSARDFFGARGRNRVLALLAALEHQPIVRSPEDRGKAADPGPLTGRVWVTRHDIHVDRIACAWLIRRFIDRQAQFKFVGEKKYRPAPGELRFDMAGAEYTHEGDNCSFETLLKRARIADPALRAIGEIIHDLDIRDRKYDRPETSGIGHAIDGICMTQHDDMARIARGGALLDDVYERFKSQ